MRTTKNETHTLKREVDKMNGQQIGRKEFRDLLPDSWTEKEKTAVMIAYQLAKYGHKGQLRDNGIRYFEHPKAVALIALTELIHHNPELVTPSLIIKCLLHDIQEDTFILDGEQIEYIFGSDIRTGVGVLTKDKKLPREARNQKYRTEIIKADEENQICKLLDRLHNMRDLSHCEPRKQKRVVCETLVFYLFLARRLNRFLYEELDKACANLQPSYEKMLHLI